MVKMLWIFILAGSWFALQNLKPVDKDSSVKFRIKNFGGTVIGSFKGLEGTIVFDASDLSKSSFDVTVDVNTINTGIDLRDKDLKKEKYFNLSKYPKIRVESSKVTKDNKGEHTYLFSGQITIKGKKKEIQFPFTTSQVKGGTMFKAEFPLNRRDFDVGGSSISLSDNLTVSLAVLGK